VDFDVYNPLGCPFADKTPNHPLSHGTKKTCKTLKVCRPIVKHGFMRWTKYGPNLYEISGNHPVYLFKGPLGVFDG
jgi:hypothetical protein